MRAGRTIQTFYGHLNTINDAVFSIGGKYVGTCDSDGIVKVWDVYMVQELMTLDVGDTYSLSLSFDKSSKYLAVGCADSEIKMVNLEKGEVTNVLKCSDGDAVNALYINHNNDAIYSAGNDGCVRIWK